MELRDLLGFARVSEFASELFEAEGVLAMRIEWSAGGGELQTLNGRIAGIFEAQRSWDRSECDRLYRLILSSEQWLRAESHHRMQPRQRWLHQTIAFQPRQLAMSKKQQQQ